MFGSTRGPTPGPQTEPTRSWQPRGTEWHGLIMTAHSAVFQVCLHHAHAMPCLAEVSVMECTFIEVLYLRMSIKCCLQFTQHVGG